MNVEQLENGVFSNETLALLILNELRMTRRDMNVGMTKLEAKLNFLCQDKNDFNVPHSEYVSVQENPVIEEVHNMKSMSDSPTTRIFPSDRKIKKAKRNENGQKLQPQTDEMMTKSKDIPIYTVHVDVNDFDEAGAEDIFEEDVIKIDESSSDAEIKSGISHKTVQETNHRTFYVNDIVADKDGRYHCDLCTSSYTSRGNLQRHYRSHTGEKRFQCPVCYRSFYRNEYLKHHMTRHTRPSRKRAIKTGLSTDDKLESGKKDGISYLCEVCKRTFAVLSDLEQHMQKHREGEPYDCELCGKKFIKDDLLKSHMKKVHHIV